MCFPGGGASAERSGGLQGGLGAQPPAGSRGGAPAGS